MTPQCNVAALIRIMMSTWFLLFCFFFFFFDPEIVSSRRIHLLWQFQWRRRRQRRRRIAFVTPLVSRMQINLNSGRSTHFQTTEFQLIRYIFIFFKVANDFSEFSISCSCKKNSKTLFIILVVFAYNKMAPICIFCEIFGIFWISKKRTLLKIQFLNVSIFQKYFYTKNWMKSDAFKLLNVQQNGADLHIWRNFRNFLNF